MSPLWSIPYFNVDMFKIDWLHACDLGITCDFLGSLFTYIADRMPGRNHKLRCKELHVKMNAWYKDNPTHSKLDQLTPTMLKKEKAKFPKLRAKAGEARALVPFAEHVCKEVLGNSVEDRAVTATAATLMCLCYLFVYVYHVCTNSKYSI